MADVTRRALRVYTALSELRGKDEDILDAIIPFFDPVLEAMNGTLFDPQLLSVGVKHLYGWRFTKDVAEQFVPRLARKGLLKRHGDDRSGAYVVKFDSPDADNKADQEISDIFNNIIDYFEKFPPRVTDLLEYSRTRDQLKEILICFLVSIDGYSETSFQSSSLGEEEAQQPIVRKLPEGGKPLAPEDRYMCARFVRHLCSEKPEWIPHLARLASIGLLTEVIEDFVKPTQAETRVELTVVVDAPLALDYLGCSGKALQADVKSIFESLKSIGCSLVVFPITCEEMSRNLTSMLSLPLTKRHGYTHEAMCRGEVMSDFIESVARDPERALKHAGIQLKQLDLQQYPNSHTYFDSERYEDFFAEVYWVADIAPREHDATCLTLTMRLREGKHSSDIFRSNYVFVTRNPTFVKESKFYCVRSHLIRPVQVPPVIHQRELATVAWLRTGLGADAQIPTDHLIGTCDRILRVRPEVRGAVEAKLNQITPEKLEQFELLLLDYRSLRKLADETLNDERVVTADNAEHLLEVMKKATAEEERAQYDQELQRVEQVHKQQQAEVKAQARNAAEERDAALNELKRRHQEDDERWIKLSITTNKFMRRIDFAVSAVIVAVAVLSVANHFTGYFDGSALWTAVITLIGALASYHLTMEALDRPTWGLSSALSNLSSWVFHKRLAWAGLSDFRSQETYQFNRGRIELIEDMDASEEDAS